MMDYRLLDGNRIIISENGKNVFSGNVVISDEMAWLDSMQLSGQKKKEIYGNLANTFNFFSSITQGVRELLSTEGIDVKNVGLLNFSEIKKFDMVAESIDKEFNSGYIKSTNMR